MADDKKGPTHRMVTNVFTAGGETAELLLRKERRARAEQMVQELESTHSYCGYVLINHNVVLRRSGSPYTDTPTMYDEDALNMALAEHLLVMQPVRGSHESWQWATLPAKAAQ